MILKYILLGFLNYGPLTGYHLKRLIDQSIANFWYAELSQIYTTLKKLEADGLITSQVEPQADRPDRRIYTITDAGREDLQKWLREPLLEASPVKEPLLVKLFFSSSLPKQNLMTQLTLQKELHQQKLTYYRTVIPTEMQGKTSMLSASPNDMLLWEATRRAGELYEEMYIRWLDEIIAQIEHQYQE